VQLVQLSAERDRLNIEWGQLQLEQSAWSNHGFVERVASDRLRMTLPRPDEVRIVAP
jgi:cell division protein FtsL